MALDEFLLEGTFPGTLEMVGEVEEIYEWMEGPLASHFLCPKPPSADEPNGTKSMCYLPDGTFISDNLIELRQVRMAAVAGPVPSYAASAPHISLKPHIYSQSAGTCQGDGGPHHHLLHRG